MEGQLRHAPSGAMSKRVQAPLPEPEGRLVSERPNRLIYHSEDCLKSEGWTKWAVAKFLPVVPDLIGPGPFSEAGDPPMKYWLRRRVTQICLARKDFQNWRLRRAIARANAKERAADERRAEADFARLGKDLFDLIYGPVRARPRRSSPIVK